MRSITSLVPFTNLSVTDISYRCHLPYEGRLSGLNLMAQLHLRYTQLHCSTYCTFRRNSCTLRSKSCTSMKSMLHMKSSSEVKKQLSGKGVSSEVVAELQVKCTSCSEVSLRLSCGCFRKRKLKFIKLKHKKYILFS